MSSPPEVVWPNEFPFLETSRLSLRQFRDTDLHPLFMCLSNPDTARYVVSPIEEPEILRGVLDEYIHGCRSGVSINWVLEEKAEGRYAGSISLQDFMFYDGVAEVSFELDIGFAGRGLMTEAIDAVLKHGFETMGLNRIEARVAEGNLGSLKLLKRAGFTPEGRLREALFLNGSYMNIIVLGRLRTDPA